MIQHQEPDNNTNKHNEVFFRGGFYWIAAGAAALCTIVIWCSRAFGTLEGQYAFIGQNILNVLIVSAILVQALIYRRQWDEMRCALRLSRETAYREQTAYIVLDQATIEHFEIGNVPQACLTFINAGKTPAKDVTIHSYFRPLDRLPDVLKAEEGPFQGDTSRHVFPPLGVPITSYAKGEMLTQATWSEMVNKGERYYVWGVAVYKDVFGKNRRTSFCLVQHPDPDKKEKAIFCSEGNDID